MNPGKETSEDRGERGRESPAHDDASVKDSSVAANDKDAKAATGVLDEKGLGDDAMMSAVASKSSSEPSSATKVIPDFNEGDLNELLSDHQGLLDKAVPNPNSDVNPTADTGTTGHVIQGQPGAYAIGGIFSTAPLPVNDAPSNTTGSHHESHEAAAAVPPPPGRELSLNSHSELVEANLIRTEEAPQDDLEAAEPVYLDAVTATRQKAKKRQQRVVLVTLLVLLGFVAMFTVGLVVGTTRANATPVPSETQSTAVNSSTISGASLSPTSAPSSASAIFLEKLLQTVPSATAGRIGIYGSPQNKAFEWISGHPLLAEMEEWKKVQLFALVTFFYSFEGPSWPPPVREDWLDAGTDECHWFSGAFGAFSEDAFFHFADVDFDNSTGPSSDPNITELDDDSFLAYINELKAGTSCNEDGKFEVLSLTELSLRGLQPMLPPEIAMLTSLKRLDLADNTISLPLSQLLPGEFFQLSQLEEIQLQHNPFYDTIVSEFGLMENLRELYLFNCALTGTLPTEILAIDTLSQLIISENVLTGGLPSEIGRLSNLSWVDLGSNLLSTIPSEIGLLTSIEFFLAQSNLLSSSIPSEVGNMQSLLFLDLSWNTLTGSLPSELFELSTLIELVIDHSLIEGTISTDIGRMSNLRTLIFSETSIQGVLPSEIGLLSLESLRVSSTQVTGTIPSELGLSTTLFEVVLDGTDMSGQIPTELSQLTGLQVFDLSNMPYLTGSIPEEIGDLVVHHTLGKLNVSGSPLLRGSIPDSICTFEDDSRDCSYWESSIWDMVPCVIDFDCTAQLCGCDCACPFQV